MTQETSAPERFSQLFSLYRKELMQLVVGMLISFYPIMWMSYFIKPWKGREEMISACVESPSVQNSSSKQYCSCLVSAEADDSGRAKHALTRMLFSLTPTPLESLLAVGNNSPHHERCVEQSSLN